jgi:hypothetical protein
MLFMRPLLVITHTASEKNFRSANFYNVEDMNGGRAPGSRGAVDLEQFSI